MQKIKQHYDIFINDKKYKVLTCNICEEKRLLLKTKIKGQDFPQNGKLLISIPSDDLSRE